MPDKHAGTDGKKQGRGRHTGTPTARHAPGSLTAVPALLRVLQLAGADVRLRELQYAPGQEAAEVATGKLQQARRATPFRMGKGEQSPVHTASMGHYRDLHHMHKSCWRAAEPDQLQADGVARHVVAAALT